MKIKTLAMDYLSFYQGDAWVTCSSVEEYKDELDFEWVRDCNTWDPDKCPNPCETYSCPDFSKCIDLSTLTDPVPHCECQMGRVFLPETGQCIKPLPPPPTPRPIPELDEVSHIAQKALQTPLQ